MRSEAPLPPREHLLKGATPRVFTTVEFVPREVKLLGSLLSALVIGHLLKDVGGNSNYVSPSDSRLAVFRPYFLGVLGIGVLGAAVYLSPLVRNLVPRAWLSRLPMFDQLQRIDRTARVLVGKTWTLLGAYLLTAFLQAMAIGAYFMVAVALSMIANLGNVLEYYTYFYTGVLVQTLPGPPQGLGTVELAYRFFLAPFGSPSQIVCVAFAVRLVVLVCALPGLLVTLTGSYRPQDVSNVQESAELQNVPAEPPSAAGKHGPAAR